MCSFGLFQQMFDRVSDDIKVSIVPHFSSYSVKSMLGFRPNFSDTSPLAARDEVLHGVNLPAEPALVGDVRMFPFIIAIDVPLLVEFVEDEASVVTSFSYGAFVVVKYF